jgi:hypothetical protein
MAARFRHLDFVSALTNTAATAAVSTAAGLIGRSFTSLGNAFPPLPVPGDSSDTPQSESEETGGTFTRLENWKSERNRGSLVNFLIGG